MVYRILRDTGYLYRVRIYNFTEELECESAREEEYFESDDYLNVASTEEILDKLESISSNEDFYINGTFNI